MRTISWVSLRWPFDTRVWHSSAIQVLQQPPMFVERYTCSREIKMRRVQTFCELLLITLYQAKVKKDDLLT